MNVEQRVAIKFCVKNGFSRIQIIEYMTNAYGDTAPKKTAIYKWYKRFEEGRESLTDDERSGRPGTLTSSDVTVIQELLNKDRRITLRELAVRTDCSYGKVFNIVHEQLNMRRISARWIPKMITDDQKQMRKESCKRILGRFQREGPTLWKESLLWMRHGSVSIRLRQSSNRLCGRRPAPHPPRSLNRPSLPRNRCSSSSLMPEVWS